MTLPWSGELTLAAINAEFGRGANLGAHRNVGWWTDDNQKGVFGTGPISLADFYGKRSYSPVVPGTWDSSTPGQHTFVIPIHDWLTVEVWGGGGGGGTVTYQYVSNGTNGTQSSALNVFASGGGGGGGYQTDHGVYTGPNAPHGGASGGSVNTTGGGSAGGAGGTGTVNGSFVSAFPGGNGGYASRTWGYRELGYGASTTIEIGRGGVAFGGSEFNEPSVIGRPGANGRVRISWG